MARLFLGVDVSTTGAKALLVDASGKVVASATTALTVSTPRPLWSEQDPQEWWTAVARSLRATRISSRSTTKPVSWVSSRDRSELRIARKPFV